MGGLEGTDYIRIAIAPPLPCSLTDCGRPARRAIVERDDEFPELWRLLPICDACARRLSFDGQDARHAARFLEV